MEQQFRKQIGVSHLELSRIFPFAFPPSPSKPLVAVGVGSNFGTSGGGDSVGPASAARAAYSVLFNVCDSFSPWAPPRAIHPARSLRGADVRVSVFVASAAIYPSATGRFVSATISGIVG